VARRTTWLIDMGDGTWAVTCMACRIALYRGPKAGADRAAHTITANPSCPSAADAGRPDYVAHARPRCGGAIPDPARGRTRRPPPTSQRSTS
jgi:hypothetical protein